MKQTDNTMEKNILRIQSSGLLVAILNVICLEIVDKQDSSSELSVLIALALFLFDIIMACVYWKYFCGYFYKEDYFVMRSYRTLDNNIIQVEEWKLAHTVWRDINADNSWHSSYFLDERD